MDLTDSTTQPACDACGKPLAGDEGPCPWCEGRGYGNIDGVLRWATYDATVRHLVHLAKFEGRADLAEWMGRQLGLQAAAAGWGDRVDVVAYVPLHRRRAMLRGYDQSQLAAGQVARQLGKRLVMTLVRDQATPPQTSLDSVGARRANVRDAFILVDAKSIAGRRVLLVDDVLTTGATLRSAARQIRAAGVASLHVAALAVADPRKREFGEV